MYRKGAVDRKRSALFSKLARLIIVAARAGGGDPDGNLRLKYAIEKAKAGNMTKDSIERAILKGTGELNAQNYEEVTYEGYALGGVAIMASGLTDNRARTAGELKSIFDRRNGNIGTPGSVAWQFEKKSIVRAPDGGKDEDEVFLALADAGADDIRHLDGVFEVLGPPDAMGTLRDAVAAAGLEVSESQIAWEPKNTVPVSDVDLARKILGLMAALQEHDDIQAVAANFDIPEDVLAAAAAEADG
jgi:YebC/PmpR family DNA-binding regulatory protein